MPVADLEFKSAWSVMFLLVFTHCINYRKSCAPPPHKLFYFLPVWLTYFLYIMLSFIVHNEVFFCWFKKKNFLQGTWWATLNQLVVQSEIFNGLTVLIISFCFIMNVRGMGSIIKLSSLSFLKYYTWSIWPHPFPWGL